MSEKPAVGISAPKAAEALEKWLEDEIKGRTGRYFDLGKFLFSVSTGLLVFFVTAQSVLGSQQGKIWLLICVVISFAGVVATLLLIWPRNIKVGANLDVLAEFNSTLRYQRRVLLVWFGLTMAALVAGSLSLAKFEEAPKIFQ